MNEEDKINDEIKQELEKTTVNHDVEDVFTPDGRMKYETKTMTGPTNSAKKKTMFISFGIISIILLIAFIFTSLNGTTDRIPNPTPSASASATEPPKESEKPYAIDTFVDMVSKNEGNFVSNDGYLYDITDKAMNDSVIYVYESDVTKQEGEPSENLSLYSVEQTDSLVTLTDKDHKTYELSKADFESLMAKYYTNNESIVYPKYNSADYSELAFMSMMEMNKSDSIKTDFVNSRYIAINGDYGVAIVSPKGQDDDLHGYVFKKQNNLWEIVVAEYQTINNYENFVNNKYGYMDIDLLLNRDINKYAKEDFNVDLDGYVNGLLQNGMLEQSDLPLTYGVSVDNVTYLEFNSRKVFVVVPDSKGIITGYPVVNAEEAKILIEKFSNDPPYIILKQY